MRLEEGRFWLSTMDRSYRQLYVLRDVAVPTGRATVDVRLTRLDSSAARRTREERPDDPGEAHERREDDEDDDDDADRGDARRRRMADEVPAVLRFRDTVELRPREVLLVTYDQSQRRLRAARGGP